MKWPVALGWVVVATSVAPAIAGAAAPTFDLEIARHEDVPLDDATLDRILKAASVLLADGSDYKCGVTFKRAKVTTISRKSLPSVLRGWADFETLQKLPGDIKVVAQIQWCGGTTYQQYRGCAGPRSGLFAITPISQSREGVLWAHEFAHCKGAGHDSSNRPRRLMNEYVEQDHQDVSKDECAMITTVGASNCGVPPLSGGKDRPKVQPLTPPPKSLAEVVRREWVHGVPYELVGKFDVKDGLQIAALLGLQEERLHWANIVTALGMLGAPEFVEPLNAFFLRGAGILDDDESRAKFAVPVAMGLIVNKSGARSAAGFLNENSNPKHVSVSWRPIHLKGQHPEWTGREIAMQCAIGLALSGTPGAASRLAEIAMSIERGAFRLDTSGSPKTPVDVIEELRVTHARVAKEGLAAQFKSRGTLD